MNDDAVGVGDVNGGGAQQHLLLHPYPTSMVMNSVVDGANGIYAPHSQTDCKPIGALNFAPTGAATFDITTNSWCNNPFVATTYHDMQTMEPQNYSNEISALNYSHLSNLKYDYSDVNNIYQKTQNQDSINTMPSAATSTSSDPIGSGSSTSDNGSMGSSSVDCSISPDTILMPMVKRGRPTENPCWSYFHRIDDQLVRCRICTKLVKSACATNMTKHLERHHSEDYEKLSEQIRLYRLNDAGFKTKIQYLTHMNPPESSASAPSSQAQPSDSIETSAYLAPKIHDSFESPPPPPQYYDISGQTVGVAAYPSQFDQPVLIDGMSQWHLSHFWQNHNSNQIHETSLNQNDAMINSESAVETSESSSIQGSSQTLNVRSTIAIPQIQRKNGSSRSRASAGYPTPTERPYMKRNRKTEHPVWEYFKRTSDGNAECTICSGVVKSPCSSNFMRHLMRHHGDEYNDVYLKWLQKRTVPTSPNQMTSATGTVAAHSVNNN